jgi:hypothetical protein
MTTMRAKFRVTSTSKVSDTQENVVFNAVGPKGSYPADGSDEDNTFACYTPSAELRISIVNPSLCGQFEVGQTFYADFTPAD